MKVLIVNKFLYPNGGSETYIFSLGNHLISQGHEVQYFGMDHADRCVGNAADAYTSDMDFHHASLGTKLKYSVKTIYSLEARRKIRLVLDDFGPDVIHLNNFNYQLTPSILVEIDKWKRDTGNNCRIIYTAHDYNLICPNHMLYNPNSHETCTQCLGGNYWGCVKGKCIHGSAAKSWTGAFEAAYWKRRKIYEKIDAVICCSRFIKDKLDTSPSFYGKTTVLHNFIEKMDMAITPKDNYVLYFGRFSEEKGIRTLLKVCRELPKIPFVFAGSGPLDEEINRVPNIENVGFHTGEELNMLIRKARFSVYPSEWYENCPFSVMESQILGTPVLGAAIGGIPEIIQEGKTGELFQANNADDLKQKIAEMYSNDERINRYSRNCQCAGFDDIEQYYRKLMKIYKGERYS